MIMFYVTAMQTLFVFIVGCCIGSFALATAWRIHKKRDFVRERSECESCQHVLAARDLLPLVSWLSLKGRCRYCNHKISRAAPLSELLGGAVYVLSFTFWPDDLGSNLGLARFIIWCVALVLLLILFLYDLRWYILPNKVIHPLWALAVIDFALRFGGAPSIATLISGLCSVIIAAGLFWMIYVVSKGEWIGYGDVRLGLVIGLMVGGPLLASLTLFVASVVGVLVALPSLASHDRTLGSKLPFGPLLIIGLIVVRLFGQQAIDWYSAHLLLFP